MAVFAQLIITHMPNIKPVSLDLPSDINAESQKIARARKTAEMLQQQSMSPSEQGQMVSGHYVAPSPLSALTRVLQGYAGYKGMEKADKADAELGRKSNEMLAQGLQNYQETMQGQPAQDFQVMDDEYGPQTATAPAVPGSRQKALAQLLKSGHPMLQQMGIQQMTAKQESPFGKVNPNDYTQESVGKFAATGNFADLVPARKMEVNTATGQVFNPYEAKPGTVFADPNKPFAVGEDGKPVANLPLQAYEIEKAKKGATNVSVKTDVKTGESLAAQVGPMMKDSTSIADGAVKQVDAAQRIVKAIDSGNVITGPTATLRLRGAQVAQMLGIGGKDDAEKIENTRNTVRGFAELTLQGRQQMKGQGAITESEGKLAEKAMSGDLDDLTAPEIKQLAKASERAARFNYGEHQRKMKVMEGNPALQGIAPFYQGPEILPEAAAPTQAPAQAPAGVRRYNPQTGRIE